MSTSVLRTSPEEMERAAWSLRAAGEQIEAAADRLLGGAPQQPGWSGLAAWEASARTRAVHRVTRAAAGAPREAATAVLDCAAAARVASQEVSTWTRRAERARAEVLALQLPGPPPEPGLELLRRRRIEQLQHEEALARRRVAAVEDEFREQERAAARRVAQAWDLLQEVRDLATAPRKAVEAFGYAWGTGERVVRTTQLAVQLARARWSRAADLRRQALRRAARALSRLRALVRVRGGAALGRVALVPGPHRLVTAWLGAWGDVRDGGGYAGWRGEVTRGLAAAGIVGGFMVVPGTALHPAVGGVGVGLLTVWAAWSSGNAAWDGGSALVRYARRHGPPFLQRTGRRVAVASQRALSRLRGVRESLLGPAGVRHRVVGLPGGRVRLPSRELVDRLVGRLPGTEPVREWWRRAGDPLLMPVVRAPVLPGPVRLGRWLP
ncbi:hypothetical protein AVL62_09585 [Serinicoccus chungangensis]|uniref:Uncharacterized protein n=1 Tax=Serinicoccus chungangensis TaxID=767452 RepID=A0A0W8I1G3_9MICO|nr:hypothetical protein [Serinicoccus chungangensis]KUG51565.1 hypothetical protein AVL62_09585 [Serinicoccus chungangensis]